MFIQDVTPGNTYRIGADGTPFMVMEVRTGVHTVIVAKQAGTYTEFYKAPLTHVTPIN